MKKIIRTRGEAGIAEILAFTVVMAPLMLILFAVLYLDNRFECVEWETREVAVGGTTVKHYWTGIPMVVGRTTEKRNECVKRSWRK